ncbi:hypothetical protein V8E51_016614 [Hyaloscypha variabilis]
MNYTPPVFEPVVYIPADWRDYMRNLPAQAIHAVGHDPIPGGANHWCFYLQTDQQASVRVDMIPSYSQPSTVLAGGSKGNMVISYLQSPYSDSATWVETMALCENLTVGFLLDYIVASNSHRFEFDGSGQGCRTWISDQIELLSNAQYITSPVTTVLDAIHLAYPSRNPVALTPGAYY